VTAAVSHILEEVAQLSEAEQRDLRRAIVAKVAMTNDLTEDDFATLAAERFREMDEEDAKRGA
jgi:hypothetical protein